MAERISTAMIDTAFRLACDAAKNAGVDTTGWILEHGNTATGIRWRLMCRGTDTHRAAIGGYGGYLGSTRADTHARLTAYQEAWLLVAESRPE